MKKTGRKLMAMAVCTAMIAAMTGCGSTAEPATTESTVSTEAKTVEATTEEAAATAATTATTKSGYPIGDSVQAIIDKGVLVVGTDSAYAPFAFVDTTSDSSDPVGIDVEIAKAIADEIGVDIQLEPMQFKALLS